MGGGSNAKFGLAELIIFLCALVAGTGCSLTSKILLDMESIGLSGELEKFSYPLFQTFGMFIGMTAGLAMHFTVLHFKLPFPGYNHKTESKGYSPVANGEAVEATPIPMWMYFALIIPALFDLVATALCMFGLRYVNVSIYQMLRGGAIVFVAILKHFMLGDHLKKFMWVGVFWNVVSIVLVGASAMLASPADNAESNPLLGVALILTGAFVQSLQYAFEEKVMSMDIAAPPLLLIGMEGFWGTVFCLFVLYPLAYYIPGPDHGSIENPFNTMEQIKNSTSIQMMFTLYFFCIFFYNTFAVLVTYMLNSVWHAILDNFRPITVWITDLFIFYTISTSLGEQWTVWSWVQLGGMVILLYGTGIYNAPNPGSLKLTGGLLDCCMDFTAEYDEMEAEAAAEEAEIAATSATPAAEAADTHAGHTVFSTMSPFMSPRATAGATPIGMTPRTRNAEMRRRENLNLQQNEYRDYGNYGSTVGGSAAGQKSGVALGMVPLSGQDRQKSFA